MGWLLNFLLSLAICSTANAYKTPEIKTNWGEHADIYSPIFAALRVVCELPDGTFNFEGDTMDLYLDDVLVKRKTSKFYRDDGRSFAQDFSINDTRLLTKKLRCIFTENSTKTSYISELPVLGYFSCPPESLDCVHAECPSSDDSKLNFCLWASMGKEQCRDSFDPKWCLANEYPVIYGKNPLTRYCPVDALGSCAAMAKDSSRIWYTSTFKTNSTLNDDDDDELATQCLKNISVSPISYKGKPLNMHEYVVVDPGDTTLRVDCPVGSPFYGMDVVPHWKYRWHATIGACINHMDVRLNFTKYFDGQDITPGVETFPFDITLKDKESGGEAKFTFGIVTFGTMGLSIRSKDDTGLLQCSFSRHFSEEAGKFKHIHWWTRDGASDARINFASHSDRLTYLNVSGITEPHEYQCHATITFKSCSPYVSVTSELHSEIYKYPPSIETTTSRAGQLNRFFTLFTALLMLATLKING